MQEKRL